MIDGADISTSGVLLQFSGAVVSFRQWPGSPRKRIGDTLVYVGFAACVGGFLWWLFP
jgi:hypothetical protein